MRNMQTLLEENVVLDGLIKCGTAIKIGETTSRIVAEWSRDKVETLEDTILDKVKQGNRKINMKIIFI